MDGLSPNQFKGVHINAILVVEDPSTLHILIDDIDNADGNIIGELARQRVQKHKNTVRLLRYNHLIYVNNIIAYFQSFQYPKCMISFKIHSYRSDI